MSAERHCINQIGETSVLLLSIYTDEEKALALQEIRESYKNDTEHLFIYYFFYEGNIKLLVDGEGNDLLDKGRPKIDWETKVSELQKQVSAQSEQLY